MKLGIFFSLGQVQFQKGCCRIDFLTTVTLLSLTLSTRPCGTSLPCMTFCKQSKTSLVGHRSLSRKSCVTPSKRSSLGMPREHATAFASMLMDYSQPANLDSKSRGW